MQRRQLSSAVVVATLLALGSIAGVLAKDDAFVTLDASLPRDPEPGSEITIGWTVQVPGQDGRLEPFNAEAMFVRLIPATGEPIEAVGTQSPLGHYVATVTVPDGGLADVQLGLRGESCSGGTCARSDLMFAIDDSVVPVFAPGGAAPAGGPNEAPVPSSGSNAAPVVSSGSAATVAEAGDLRPLGLLGLGIAAAGVVLGLFVLRARGRELTPGSSRS